MGIYDEILKQSDNAGELCGLGLGEAAAAAKAKRIHQRILQRLILYLSGKLIGKYEAINEGEIGDTDTEIPDIVIWTLDKNNVESEPIVAIEITTTNYEKENINKLRNLFFSYPTLKECFLFNYDTNNWLQVIKSGGTLENSKSEYLSNENNICDFATPFIYSDIKHLFGLHERKRNK